MKCNFCNSELELQSVGVDRGQNHHWGTSDDEYVCNTCDSEVVLYKSGHYRSGSNTHESIDVIQEIVPSGYMNIVDHEDNIVYSGRITDEELRRAIKKCKENCPDDENWYIIEGRKRCMVRGDKLVSDVDSVSDYNINPVK